MFCYQYSTPPYPIQTIVLNIEAYMNVRIDGIVNLEVYSNTDFSKAELGAQCIKINWSIQYAVLSFSIMVRTLGTA